MPSAGWMDASEAEWTDVDTPERHGCRHIAGRARPQRMYMRAVSRDTDVGGLWPLMVDVVITVAMAVAIFTIAMISKIVTIGRY